MLFRKELLKIGISAAVGLIISLFLMEQFGWLVLLILPLYAVGTVYAFRWVLTACQSVLQWFANMIGISVATFNVLGCLSGLLIMIIGLALTLSVTWVIGIGIAIYRLIDAVRQQNAVRRPGNPNTRQLPGNGDDWDSTPPAKDDWGL